MSDVFMSPSLVVVKFLVVKSRDAACSYHWADSWEARLLNSDNRIAFLDGSNGVANEEDECYMT